MTEPWFERDYSSDGKTTMKSIYGPTAHLSVPSPRVDAGRNTSAVEHRRKTDTDFTRCGTPYLIMSHIVRSGIAAILGALFGVAVSWIVNCTLVEISLNSFFSVYFGSLFLLIGGIIFWRVLAVGPNDRQPAKKPLLVCFASLVVLSGVMCFILDENWVHLSAHAKIPLYTLLGISVCFALVFSSIDVLNWIVGSCQHASAKALVETPRQVYLILGVSVIMGAAFGFIFGTMDVEDAAKGWDLREALVNEEKKCYPLGLILGAIAAVMNEKLRNNEDSNGYDPIRQQDNFDDDDF